MSLSLIDRITGLTELIDAHGAASAAVSAALSLCAFAALLAALRPAPAPVAEQVT